MSQSLKISNKSMENSKEIIIEIFSGALWEAQMIASLLEDAEIRTFLKNAVLQSYAYNPTYAAGVKVMINSADYEAARVIIDNYLRSQQSSQ
jgi:hypothetical protein